MVSELSVGMSRGGGRRRSHPHGKRRRRMGGRRSSVDRATRRRPVPPRAGAQVGLDRLRLAPELQRGRAARDVCAQKVRIRQLCGHAPERERDDAGGHLAHAELQQRHAAVAALAYEALVSPEALLPCRALQERVVAYPRYELPAAVRASGDVLAADLKPRHAARPARAA